MNWYIGQEVIWAGLSGREKGDPCNVTGIRQLPCGCIELQTTFSEIDYAEKQYCTYHPDVKFIGGFFRNALCYRPFISDSCITELVNEKVAAQ